MRARWENKAGSPGVGNMTSLMAEQKGSLASVLLGLVLVTACKSIRSSSKIQILGLHKQIKALKI